MSNSQSPEFKQRMELAREILGSLFSDFEKMISDNKVKLDTPEWDVCCFSIYSRIFEKTQILDEWENFWAKNRKPQRYENMVYFIPSSYYNFLGSKETSDYFIKIMKHFSENKIRLTWRAFLQIFFDFRSRIMPKFNPKEFLVFQTILREQELSNSELANILSMDSSNLSKYKNKLHQKYLIFEGLTLNYFVLNLATYAIVYDIPLSSKIDFF